MTTWSRVERELPDRMADLASEHRPDYLDDAFFGQMADIRQRDEWSGNGLLAHAAVAQSDPDRLLGVDSEANGAALAAAGQYRLAIGRHVAIPVAPWAARNAASASHPA